MRPFERQPGESSKAFEAWKCYRDLGADRSLAKAAETYYGTSKNLAQVGVWSSRFDWVQRARAHDDWMELTRRQAIEEWQETRAHGFAERQGRLLERLMEQAEKAADNADEMLRWPISEQRILKEGENGEDVTVIIMPARWNKATVKTMAELMANAATGRWCAAPEQPQELEGEFDLSPLDLDEQRQLQALLDRIGVKPPERA